MALDDEIEYQYYEKSILWEFFGLEPNFYENQVQRLFTAYFKSGVKLLQFSQFGRKAI